MGKKPASLDDELAKLTRVLAANPKNERALYQSGEILFKKGECERAFEHLQLLERLLQRQKEQTFPHLYELYRLLGLCCFKMKSYAQAMEYFILLRNLEDPRVDFEVLRALGILHHKSGNYPRAATLLGKAWQLNPKEVQLGAYVGRSYAALGQWKPAVEALEKVVNLLPGDIDLRWLLARGYVRLEKPQQALRVYSQLKKVPELEDSATLEEAKILLKLRKNTAEALDALNTLMVAANGELSCEAGYLLGQHHLAKNEVNKAVWYFQQVRAQDPDYQDVDELLKRYGILLRTPNLFVLTEGKWEYQRSLCRRLIRRYFHGKETILQEINNPSEIIITVNIPTTQGEEPVLFSFTKNEMEYSLERLRGLQNLLSRKGQQIILHVLGPVDAETLEFCNSRHIKLVTRERYLELLASVGKIEFEE